MENNVSMPTQSIEIVELIKSVSKMQSSTLLAREDGTNPHFKNKYATLTEVWQAARKPLTDNGLAVIQTVEIVEGKPVLVTTLGHTSGQWMKSYLPLNPERNSHQAMGSALTYARRYALQSIVGISPGDASEDDGEAAMDRTEKPKKASTTKEFYPLLDKLSKALKAKKINTKQLEEFFVGGEEADGADRVTHIKSALASVDGFSKHYQRWLEE